MSGVPSETKETPKKSHKKRNVLAALFVIVLIIAIAVSVSQPTTSPTNSTTSTTQKVVPAVCVFSTNTFGVSTAVTKNFQDCLKAGSSNGYGFALTGSSSVSTLSGTVNSEFPANVQVLEGGILGGVLYSQNDTTSAHFSNIQLTPLTGYTVYVKNLGQNNSLSVSLQFS